MTDIPQDQVEAVGKAIFECGIDASYREQAIAAIRVLTPMIAAVERERCAKIADERVKRAEFGLVLPQIDRVPLMIRREEASIIAESIRSVKGAEGA